MKSNRSVPPGDDRHAAHRRAAKLADESPDARLHAAFACAISGATDAPPMALGLAVVAVEGHDDDRPRESEFDAATASVARYAKQLYDDLGGVVPFSKTAGQRAAVKALRDELTRLLGDGPDAGKERGTP